MEQLQERALQQVPVGDHRVGRAGRRHLAQEAAQESGLDVRGDAQPSCKALLDVTFDERVGDDQRHRVEQARPAGTDGVAQRVDQRLEAVRAAKPDHVRVF